MIRKLAAFAMAYVVLVVLGFTTVHAAEPEAAKEADKTAPDRAALEKKFEEMLSGATLTGNYTSGQKNPGNLKEDKYTIEKVSKLAGDLWLFNVRIQYGNKDTTVPLPLMVLWAGDTPVITLDKSAVPGMGAFSARVVFHEGKYAGTWSGANHGGILFGTISKPGDKPVEKTDEAPPEKGYK